MPIYRFILLIIFVAVVSVVEAKPSVEDFIREPDYRMAKISPDGRHLAEVWNNEATKERVLTIKDLTTRDKKVVGVLKDKIVRAYNVSWANNDRLLVYLSVPYDTSSVVEESKKNKDFDINNYFMFSRTLAINTDGSNPVVLMEDQRRVKRNINLSIIRHFLPNDKDHILMLAYKSNLSTLFKVNVYTGRSQQLAKGSRFTYAFLNAPNGDLLYRLDYKKIAKRIEIYEYIENEWRKVNKIELDTEEDDGPNERNRGDLVALFEDDLVYLKRNEKTGYKELWRYFRKEKKFELMVSVPDADVLGIVTSDRTFDVLGYVKDGDITRPVFFDKKSQNAYDQIVQAVGDYAFHETSVTDDGKLLVLHTYGVDNPGAFWIYDREKKEATFLNHRYFGIATENLSIPARAKYKARDGKMIRSYLLFPPNYEQGKKFPLVIYPHGGPHVRDRLDYDDFAQFISTRGYIVVRPNFRGSTGYGKEFEEAGYRQWGLSMQDDLTDAAEFMIKKGYADRSKVCIVGASYGGYAALMGVIKTPDLFKCSISINAPTNLVEMVNTYKKSLNDKDLTQKYVFDRIGHPVKDQVMLNANSPVFLADKVFSPVLVIAGDADERVPFSHSKKMVKALKKYNKHHKFVRLKDTGHNPFYYREGKRKVYKEVEKFLALYL